MTAPAPTTPTAPTAATAAAQEPDAGPSRAEALERWLSPILFKDLLTFARNPAGGTGRLLGYGLLFAAPVLGFGALVAFAPGPWRFLGQPVFLIVCAFLAFFHLGVAVSAATALALERDRNTLESLVVSPLGPWRIVGGKLAAALAVGLLSKAVALPALAVAYVLGGADLGFIPRYLLLLVAFDTSLAAFALNVGARHRDAPSKVGWVRAQVTQSQLALQAAFGLAIAGALIPLYALIFIVPLAIQHGARVAEVLEQLAPIGALHPLAALIFWGDADLFGVRCPVWLLGVLLHVLIALPLLADCAEAQRPDGVRPGVLPRLLALPVVAFVLLGAGAIAVRLEPLAQTALALGVPGLFLLWGAVRTGFGGELPARVSAGEVLRGLLPHRALESAPARAPGYVLLLGLVCAPLFVWGGGGGASALGALAALTLTGMALAALGVRMTGRLQGREDQAFLDLLEAGPEGSAAEPEEEAPPRAPPRRVLFYLLLFATLVPVSAGVGLAFAEQGYPILGGLRPLLLALLVLGIALNPFAAFLPVLSDPQLAGSEVPLRMLEAAGLAPELLFAAHLLLYGGILVAAVASLRPPLDLDAVLAARRAAEEGAPAARPEGSPP